MTLEDFLESERHKLTGKLTPVTPESFAEWKKKRLDKKAAEEQVSHLPLARELTRTPLQLGNADTINPRPAMPRRQQVVPCSRVASGGTMRTMTNQATKRTKTLPRGTWRSYGRRQKRYGPRRKRSGWQRRATNLPRMASQQTLDKQDLRKTLQKTARLVRRTAPLQKSPLPPPREESERFWGQKIIEGPARRTRLFARQTTFGVAPLSPSFRCIPNGCRIRQGRRESGRTHPSEATIFLPAIFTAYALNGENHVYRQERWQPYGLHLQPGVPRTRDIILPGKSHLLTASALFAVDRDIFVVLSPLKIFPRTVANPALE